MKDKVVLFDGVCSLCNASVDFIVRNESGNELKFASLQSDYAQKILEDIGAIKVPDSILFYEKDRLMVESSAALAVAKYLRWPYRLVVLCNIVPRFLRDWVYRLIARNRYRWFGKRDTCRVPTAAEREKFLG